MGKVVLIFVAIIFLVVGLIVGYFVFNYDSNEMKIDNNGTSIIEKEECEDNGGFWETEVRGPFGSFEGYLENPYCRLPKFSDYGKVCNDSSQCQGACLYPYSELVYQGDGTYETKYNVSGVCDKWLEAGDCSITYMEVLSGMVNGSKPYCVD